MATQYWLFKSDPDTFGLPHLKRCKDQTTIWDGVRNYQARNLLRDTVKKGDRVLFYHSQLSPPEVVALATVVREAYTDPTQFKPSETYFDSKSKKDDPRWVAVDIRLDTVLDMTVTLPEIRETPGLEDMVLVNRSRLSIQPVTPDEWKIIVKMGRRKAR